MIYLATNHGVVSIDRAENEDVNTPEAGSPLLPLEWQVSQRGLSGKRVTSVAVQGQVVLAGTMTGVYRSEDGGETWQPAGSGLRHPHVRWLSFIPGHPDLALVGTEPAGIFTSQDGGASWKACAEVAELRDRLHWSLPYSPEAGCVRGFALHGKRVFAAVEVGGVLLSEDLGATWRLAPGSTDAQQPQQIHPDVHSIEMHPSSPDLVYAPTGGGFFRSWDGGKTWQKRYQCYVRAVWVDPDDSEHLVLGPADGVDRGGRIEESRDGGETWDLVTGEPGLHWPRHMVERFTQMGDHLFAVLSNGELLARPLAGGAWTRLAPDLEGINAAAGQL